MHRSGTSLIANYINKCGISMGDNLIGSAKGNRFGHFEDSDFVLLHDKILQFNRCHMFSPSKEIRLTQELVKDAKMLLNTKKVKYSNWGWKDPRTCLFLNFWNEIEADIKFIFLYRNPYRVIDSLFRRGTDTRIKLMPWLPANAWIKYNKNIIDFITDNKKNYALISIDGFNLNYVKGSQFISEFMGIELKKAYTSIYHPTELSAKKVELKGLKKIFSKYMFGRDLKIIYEALEKKADISSIGIFN